MYHCASKCIEVVTDRSEGASRHKRLEAALLKLVSFAANDAKLKEATSAVGGVLRDEG